jgi:hypothetical protein
MSVQMIELEEVTIGFSDDALEAIVVSAAVTGYGTTVGYC